MQVVTGLGFGDEGKGTLIDALARRAHLAAGTKGTGSSVLVVRYNGGPQAAHHVVTDHGQRHCFSQLGSGSLVPGVSTLLSRYMLIEPGALLREAAALASLGVAAPLQALSIDTECVIVTPFHKLVNRIEEELRGSLRHGSCGLGVGQAWLDSRNPSLPTLRLVELADSTALRRKLRYMQLVKIDLAEQLLDSRPDLRSLARYLEALKRADWVDRLAQTYAIFLRSIGRLDDGTGLAAAVRRGDTLLFEGAQGVLLDAERGFFPYVTPSRTTCENALALLAEAGASQKPLRLGVLRAYATRHGPGPFVTHDAELESRLPELHNGKNPWQGPMRVGWFDAVAGRYAVAVSGGCDAVALTSLDRLSGLPSVRVCVAYRGPAGVLRQLPGSPAPSREHQMALTELLSTCQPVYQELPGWSAVRSGSSLAPQVESFLRFLESAEGIGAPISIVSFGPTAADKLWRS